MKSSVSSGQPIVENGQSAELNHVSNVSGSWYIFALEHFEHSSGFELDTITIITNQVRVVGSIGSIPKDVAGVYQFFKRGLNPELKPIPVEDIDKGLKELKEGKIRGRLVAEINKN